MTKNLCFNRYLHGTFIVILLHTSLLIMIIVIKRKKLKKTLLYGTLKNRKKKKMTCVQTKDIFQTTAKINAIKPSPEYNKDVTLT